MKSFRLMFTDFETCSFHRTEFLSEEDFDIEITNLTNINIMFKNEEKQKILEKRMRDKDFRMHFSNKIIGTSLSDYTYNIKSKIMVAINEAMNIQMYQKILENE